MDLATRDTRGRSYSTPRVAYIPPRGVAVEKFTRPKGEMTMAQRRRNHTSSFVDGYHAPTLSPHIPEAQASTKNFNVDIVDQR